MGLNDDAVDVVIVQHQNIIVAGAGCDDESTRLICVNLATGWFDNSGETMVGAFVSIIAWEAVDVGVEKWV